MHAEIFLCSMLLYFVKINSLAGNFVYNIEGYKNMMILRDLGKDVWEITQKPGKDSNQDLAINFFLQIILLS